MVIWKSRVGRMPAASLLSVMTFIQASQGGLLAKERISGPEDVVQSN
jgi:hypothetical protein